MCFYLEISKHSACTLNLNIGNIQRLKRGDAYGFRMWGQCRKMWERKSNLHSKFSRFIFLIWAYHKFQSSPFLPCWDWGCPEWWFFNQRWTLTAAAVWALTSFVCESGTCLRICQTKSLPKLLFPFATSPETCRGYFQTGAKIGLTTASLNYITRHERSRT